MEALQNAPALIDNEQFGGLIQLPNVLQTNRTRAARAEMVVAPKISNLANVDLSTVDVQVMEQHDSELAELYSRLNASLELMEGERKPHTQFMDKVKTLFTTEEAKIKVMKDSIKTIRDRWQAEKARRAKIMQDELDRKIQEEQDAIRLKSERFARYTQTMLQEIGRRVDLLANGFYAQGLTTIDKYAEQLKGMVVHLTGPEYDKIIGEQTPLSAELFSNLATEFTSKLSAERDRLLDLVDSRKAELERIKNDAAEKAEADARIAEEARQRQEAQEAEQKDRQEAIEITAQAEATNATFDAHMDATPVVGISKGTVVKQKYVVQTHAGMIALLQSYIKNNLHLLTVEDMNKKFGFVVTAANVRLNDGEKIEAKGLEVVEDYSTRSTRKTA
jgi:hypothetical protein